MTIETQPIVFEADGDLALPDYLQKDISGRLWFVPTFFPDNLRPGPYDRVMTFRRSREGLKGLVPQSERLTEDTSHLEVLSFGDMEIVRAMEAITSLANDPKRSSKVSADREEYRKNLSIVYRVMADKAKAWIGQDKALVFAPKNGGIFVEEVFRKKGVDSDFYDYQMGRKHANDGELMVSITKQPGNPKISDYRTFVFADDCLASDISAYATLEMIRDVLFKAGVPLPEARVLITTSAATQRGLESILSEETRSYFGFGEMRAVVGTLVYKMDKDFYLRHPDDRFFVGDMGDWTKLPEAA